MDSRILKYDEKILLELCSMYHRYGYSRYKMSKFEEYDLYAQNKDFLISENVITYTDKSGRLMALKPDVTLSIVRNYREGGAAVQKVYYNESVYRASRGDGTFKEITQAGLECIGRIDDYAVAEVVMLAMRSLECISKDYRLVVSHQDILADAVAALGLSEAERAEALKCVSRKSLHELKAILSRCGTDPAKAERLMRLLTLNVAPEDVPAALIALGCERGAVAEIERLISAVEDREKLIFDFSIVGDMHYYNGVIFKGYLSALPEAILTGGRYDGLMRKMGRKASAIGFAVYMDLVERLETRAPGSDCDVLLLYDDTVPAADVLKKAGELTEKGLRVIARRDADASLTCSQRMRITGSGVTIVEDDA